MVGKCLNCDSEFSVRESEIKRGNGKFCSLKCSSIYNGKKTIEKLEKNVTCAFCGENFHKSPSKIKNSKSGLHFCCREHKDLAQKIEFGLKEIHPNHYGINSNYRKIAFDSLEHKCNRCGYCENKKILQVHHKDHNRNNNKLENLEILCPNCHSIEHILT